jgi:hypothetical protein
MANFFSNLFGNSDEVRKTPRRIPDFARDIPDGDDRWVVTKEFEGKSPYYREYAAAMKQDDGSWRIMLYNYSLKEDAKGVLHDSKYLNEIAASAYGAINKLREYEKKRVEKELHPVPNTRQTYSIFANRHGMHFDKQGNIIFVHQEKPVMAEMVISRDKFKQLFTRVAKTENIESWDDVYDKVVGRTPTLAGQATLESLQRDEGYARFAKDCEEYLIKTLDLLPAHLAKDPTFFQRDLRSISDDVIVDVAGELHATDRAWLAQYLTDATIVVGLLRAGAEVNTLPVTKEDGSMNQTHFDMLKSIGTAIEKICTMRLGLSERHAQQVVNVMFTGADPHGPELPLAKTLKQYPPLSAEEIQKLQAPATAAKTPATPKTPDWPPEN